MKEFVALYRAIDETTKTSRKVAAMREYFSSCSPPDGAWAVFFLTGRRFKRFISTARLREWCAQQAGISAWLFEECYGAVGDLAETLSLLLPEQGSGASGSLTDWIEHRIVPLGRLAEEQAHASVSTAWSELRHNERFVFNKLVTGEFRVGVGQPLVIRALALLSGVEAPIIAHRLMGAWEPTAEFFNGLLARESGEAEISRPYPFCLAHPLSEEIETLGDIGEWILEWKWDGIRGQLIRRKGQTFLWSRGEEPVLEKFPELIDSASLLPDGTVLDGEILAWNENGVLPFAAMQRRIGRKTLGKKLLAEVPVKFVAFDILEDRGLDVRTLPLRDRRKRLEETLAELGDNTATTLSPTVQAESWEQIRDLRATSRERGVEGFMLKRAESVYGVGRVTGLWWKWKIEPYTCDAVLIYAQRGHGRRASLYTDYTFALWHEGILTPFAKAYSGLTDEEIRQVDRYVRQNTIEKFGPVRSVTPTLVFELAFEDIQVSTRHKSGLAVRFPRIVRWRHDKSAEQADSLKTLRAIVEHLTQQTL